MKRMLRGLTVAITTCCIAAGATAAQPTDAEGFVSLFDGRTLDGWDGNPKFWSVEDGAITGQTTKDNPTQGNTFIIWRGGEVDDFELVIDYRIYGHNSGIQYRSFEVPKEKWVVGGYQADMEAGDTWSGTLYGERFRGILAKRGEKTVIGEDHKPKVIGQVGDSQKLQSHIKKEDWNTYHIIARGNHIVQKINGHVTADVTDDDKEMRRASGIVALQLHAGPPMKVQFKNIRLKRLAASDKRKKVVFVAGVPSHGYGTHEHNAGCVLLAKALKAGMPDFEVAVHQNGWPKDPAAFEGADAIVMYCDGGDRHMVTPHIEEFDRLMKQGVGLACIHYAVEIPKGKPGDALLDWIGGYFEKGWSVNPHWDAEFKTLPDHPITRGIKPFKINDEWYYHMRFRDKMDGVQPILTAVPPASSLSRPDGGHSGNPHVRAAVAKGEPQHVAWTYERPGGGRGFGFTGGHFHWNWGDDSFRKVALNAIVWLAHGDVPEGGVRSRTPTRGDLEANQDYPKPADKKPEAKTPAPAKKDSAGVQRDVRAPDQAVAGLDVPEGLEATLFAAEPMLFSPANMDIDHLGRVWISEVVNYRYHNGRRVEGDRILILEDTDGDGRADKTTVFYQGRDIDSALGIAVLGNRVIVSVAPNVFVFTDEDGDGRADKKDVLFTKVGQPQHDHSAHAFLFGPDGKLYWTIGNTGGAVHDKDGKPVVDLAGNTVVDNGKPYYGGMVFRCDVDGGEFEVLAHNFRNNFEATIDSFGTIWQSDNDDDGNRGVRINYVMEFGNYGYRDEMTGAGWQTPYTGMPEDIPLRHWHLSDPGVVPNLLQTGAGSPSGIMHYEGDLLLEVFRNQIVHCDPGPNVVRAYPVTGDGAGYKAEVQNVLHGARDNWFRPADAAVAPDGSLLVADWYDPGVGGHNMGDLGRGRIFRVAPPGHKYQAPKFDFTTPQGAAEALKNPNYAVRYLAWTSLHNMGTKAEPVLLELWKSDNPRYRARALWLLGKIEGRGEHYVQLAIKDADADLRIVGLRLARQLKLDMIPLVGSLVADASAQVRRECAIALRDNKSAGAPQLWAELAARHDGQDRWYLEALGIAAHGQWDAFLGAWLNKVGEKWNTPAGRDIIWRSRAATTPAYLAQIVRASSTPTEELPRYLRAFDFLAGHEKQQVLAELALGQSDHGNAARTAMISREALARLETLDASAQPLYAGALDRVLDREQGTANFVKLVDKFSLAARYGQLLAIAQQKSDQQIGIDAVRVLLGKRQEKRIAEALAHADAAIAASTIQALGNSADGRSVDLLLPLVKGDGDIAVRRAAIRALAQNRVGAQRLVELARKNELDESLREAASIPLATAAWSDVREAAAGLFPLPAAKDNQSLPPLAELLKLGGSVERGKQVYETTGTCNKCHLVRGQGKEVGPDLSEIGAKLSREALFESILYPSAGISHNYETYAIALASGNVLSGIITSRDANSVTVKSADAIVRTFETSQIDELKKQTVSLMPADLQRALTAQDLADVVQYLTTLKQAGK